MDGNKVGEIKPDGNGAYLIYMGANGWFVLTKAELFTMFNAASQQVAIMGGKQFREWRNDRTPTE